MRMFIGGLILGVIIGVTMIIMIAVLAVDAGELDRDPTKEEWKAGMRRR